MHGSGHTDNQNPDALLTRALGVRQFASNIFNYTVGSGIFLLPATAVARLGTTAPLAYVACAITMGLVVLCYAEAGSRVSSTGGSYAYVETSMGPAMGFIAGCFVFTTGLFAASAVLSGFVRSLLAFFTAAPTLWVTNLLAVVVAALLVAINMRGVRAGARTLEAITILKLLPLLAFVVIGAFYVRPANLAWHDVPSASEVLGTAGIVIFAFAGIEGATVPSGEIRDPARTVPRAILLALGGTTVLYLGVQYVALGVMGVDLANTGRTPLATVAGLVLGPVAKTVMLGAAIVSMFGYLSANVLSEPRGLFALSRDGFLPKVFVRVHPTFRTPNFAIVFYGVLLAIIAVSGTFEWLTIFANLAALCVYFLTSIAALKLRRADVRTQGNPFVIPGGPIVPIASCLALAWLFFETARDGSQFYALLGWLAFILALYTARFLRLRAVKSSVAR
jgi:amino acid transporter